MLSCSFVVDISSVLKKRTKNITQASRAPAADADAAAVAAVATDAADAADADADAAMLLLLAFRGVWHSLCYDFKQFRQSSTVVAL